MLATRYYAGAALHILRDLALRSDGAAHPLLTERTPVKNINVVMLTSDRGLAGPYNSNVVRAALDFEAEKDVPVQYIPVGRKGRDILWRRGSTIVAEFSGIPDSPSILDITAITRTVVDDFLSGTVDEVYVIFTDFINTLRQKATIRRLLPLKPTEGDMTGLPEQVHTGMEAVYTFEPDAQTILDEILPRFTELQLYQALLESLASEHSARMVAMRNATENAEALVGDLTLVYNKARQLAITSEMLDIVGGASALAQAQSKK